MEFRTKGTLKDRTRAARYNLSCRASVLALSAAAAFSFCPADFARAQETNVEPGAETTNGTAPAPQSDSQADGPPPSTGDVPEVVVEQKEETKPAPVKPKPKSRTVTRQPVTPSPPRPQPTIAVENVEQKAIQSIIFDLPVDGDTLNRGTSGVDGYFASGTSAATKTNTLIMNIPGSVSIITKEMAEDQAANQLGQALLYVPGITVQQGEGHRDQLTFRGQRTTADFFVDGVRDDIETFRDLYNAQTIEVLKGPLAMIFGRGGGGGVINRVTKRADGIPIYEGIMQLGSWERARFTADVGQAISSNAAFRLNAMYEDSETFRDFSWMDRYGLNPTMGFKLGERTTLHFSYEYKVHDQNVDRGGPSIGSRPFPAPLELFYGQPFASYTNFDGHIATATFEHQTVGGLQMRNHTFFADYDKLYQNIFADSAVNAPGPGLVELDGYQSTQARENFFNQTDFSYSFNTGRHLFHTMVSGLEIGIQDNDELRNLPTFVSPNSGIFTVNVPVLSPTIFTSTFYNRPNRRRFTDLETTSAFIQDQLQITRYFELIGGIRFDRFDVEFVDTLRDFTTARIDEVWSPRIGGVLKPWERLHFYASYANSFLPVNGDNFGELTLGASDLEPEEFTNHEVGFKWTPRPRLLVQGALYRLDRDNQPILLPAPAPPDTFAPGLTRTRGAEIEVSGYLTDRWQVFGGYAYTDSEILKGLPNLVGNSVDSVPVHTFSMWNKYQLTQRWGIGLGVIHQGDWFASADNLVTVPEYTRVDAAVFYDFNKHWSAQLNIENLFDTEYWISSHNNNNISYGAPASAFVTLKARW
jgi:catecholate siderophore receptor